MANKLGAAFLRCALGPLNYAGGCILSGNVADGLRELSADNLHGGLKRGVGEAARQVGVGAADVARLLPMDQVEAVAARLDAAQRAAVHAWSSYAGQVGGLLKGVADLTVDGRAPDVSNFLQRLAQKMSRDRPIADPLEALSAEVASWLDIVEQCGDLLGDGGALAEAYRRRRLQRVILGAAGGVIAIVAVAFGLSIHAARGRVEDALGRADPCAAEGIASGDLDRASADQKRRAAGALATCTEQRRRDEQAREEQRRRDEQARAEIEKKRDHEARCTALGAHVAAGRLADGDDAVMEGKGALLGRIARGPLDKGDLADADLPCADTAAGAKLADAFTAAILASPSAWTGADEVGVRAREILVAHRGELGTHPQAVFARHADDVAKKACIWRRPADLARAAKLCQLKDDLGVHTGKYCAVLFAIAGKDGAGLK
jgi:hypothetical protein